MGADQRILRGVAATLTVTLTDQNGTATDAAGVVTVAVAAADGTVVLAAGTATVHGANGSGIYTVALTAAQVANLGILTATWTDAGDGSVNVTTHEIVGGYFFSIAEARASDATLTDTAKYPDSLILTTRQEVEEECEFICDVAFVPRYARVTLDGSGTNELILPDNEIRTVRTVRTYTTPTTYTTFTAAELAALALDEDQRIVRTDTNVFTQGLRNLVAEYEHGYNRPPSDLKRASLIRLRHRLNSTRSGIPDRAISFSSVEGGTYRLDAPSRYKTGIPEVDATYLRHSRRSDGPGDAIPAYGVLDYDPQRFSLYHGPRR